MTFALMQDRREDSPRGSTVAIMPKCQVFCASALFPAQLQFQSTAHLV